MISLLLIDDDSMMSGFVHSGEQSVGQRFCANRHISTRIWAFEIKFSMSKRKFLKGTCKFGKKFASVNSIVRNEFDINIYIFIFFFFLELWVWSLFSLHLFIKVSMVFIIGRFCCRLKTSHISSHPCLMRVMLKNWKEILGLIPQNFEEVLVKEVLSFRQGSHFSHMVPVLKRPGSDLTVGLRDQRWDMFWGSRSRDLQVLTLENTAKILRLCCQ